MSENMRSVIPKTKKAILTNKAAIGRSVARSMTTAAVNKVISNPTIASAVAASIVNGTADFIFKKHVPPKVKSSPKTNPVPGEKIYSTETGLGVVNTALEGTTTTHDNCKVYKIRENFYEGSKSIALKDAKRQYGSSSYPLYSTEKTAYSRLYGVTGLNTKGIFNPFNLAPAAPAYGNIDLANPVTSQNGYYFLGELMDDTANMLSQTCLSVSGGSKTDMPALSTGDMDYLFPFQSFNMDITITNTNSFLPTLVKIYVLRAKKNLTQANTPKTSWFDLSTTAQATNKLSQTLNNYTTVDTIAGISGTPYVENAIHPQATPLMSKLFTDNYEILEIHNKRLGPSDSLKYSMTKHYGSMHSAAEYNNDSIQSVAIRQDSIHYMVEFQGVGTPYYLNNASGGLQYSGLAHSSFAKIRVVCNKSFVHSLPVFGSSLSLPGLSIFSPTFVGQKRQDLKTYADTASYQSFSATPTDPNKYVIPLVSANTIQYAQPLIKDVI